MSIGHRTRRSRRLRGAATASGILALSLIGLSACVGGGSGATESTNGAAADVPVRDGGSIVIGAEQEPSCADWLSTCAGSIWGDFIMRRTTIPVTYDIRKDGDDWVAVPSDLLTGEPTVEKADGGMTITYAINPDARWSDGKSITSADFKYTAEQIRDGKDIFDKTGYDKITGIETPDATTVVLRLDEPYADWKTLFSNTYGVLPSHLLKGKDRTATMRNGYSFSGGPWIIKSWDRGTSVTLIPNENYWGDKPHLDKVTFTFIPDTAAAFQALKSGQVDALYPTPQLNAMSQIDAGLPGFTSQVDPQSGNLEALWINNDAPPFSSPEVRRAAAYAIDREALVERIYGDVGVTDPVQSFLSPLVSAYATDEFARYEHDLDQVASLMEEEGWTKGSDGTWQKDGKSASFTIHSLAGNKRRDLMLQILQEQFAEAGFTVEIETTTPTELFTKIAPNGDFQMGLWTLVDYFPAPMLDLSFSSDNIPSESNEYSGINFGRVDVAGLDEVLGDVSSELDTERRIELSNQADELIAEAVPSIPLVAIPNILLWNEKIGGPSINPAEGPFWNLEEWGLAR